MEFENISFVEEDVPKKRKRGSTKKSIFVKKPKLEKKQSKEKVSEQKSVLRKVKGVYKKVIVGEKNTKTKKKKQKKQIDFTLIDIQTKTSYVKATKNYVIFSPYGKDAKADIIGVDIGEIHLAMTGIRRRKGKRPIVVWFSLFSLPSKAAHFVVDKVVELIWNNEDFHWIKDAPMHRIELQVGFNPKAQTEACGIRACFESLFYSREETPNVDYVHGEQKYNIAPKYSEEAREDPIRKMSISGAKGGKYRKQLGVNDSRAIMKLNGDDDKKALRFMKIFEDYADQLHDIADSHLIALAGDEELTAQENKCK
jgi:hypothetical protein